MSFDLACWYAEISHDLASQPIACINLSLRVVRATTCFYTDMDTIAVIIVDSLSDPLVIVVLPDVTIRIDIEVITAAIPSEYVFPILLMARDKFANGTRNCRIMPYDSCDCRPVAILALTA